MMKIPWRQLGYILIFAVFAISIGTPEPGFAQGPECPPGFVWQRMSGVGCVQANCLDIGNSKYTYTGTCSCTEGYKGCYQPVNSIGVACAPFCPASILVACIAPDASCPGENPSPTVIPPADSSEISPPEPDNVPSEEVETQDSISELLHILEELLAGKEVQSPTPGRAALGSLIASVLMGIWILVNLYSNPSVKGLETTKQEDSPSLGSTDPSFQDSEITKIYSQAPDNFRQCQDMVYAELWKQSPPDNKGQDKAKIFEKMSEEGYWQANQGGMYDPQGAQAKLKQLQDGDILMFGAQGMPDEQGANHYAVVAGGKIYEILNLPNGGEMHVFDAKDAYRFFEERTYQSRNDGKTYPLRPYYGFKVFRK